MLLVHLGYSQWEQIGPYGGDIRCITAIDSKVFAGTNGAGVYISNDYGTTWNTSNNGLYQNAGVPFVKKIGYNIFLGASKLYKSTNDGLSWELSSNGIPNGYSVNTIIEKDGSLFVGTVSKGIYKSYDNGLSWEHCGLDSLSVGFLCVSNSRILASVWGDRKSVV